MIIIILVLILLLLSLIVKAKPFETIFLSLILTPIFSFLIGKIASLNTAIYLVCFAVSYFLSYTIFKETTYVKSLEERLKDKSSVAVGFFILSYLITHTLVLKWPDFMPMGERLRDYALLGSVIKTPLEANEPWMTGSNLNYYLYWYRFGAMMSKSLSMPVWDTYHFLSAFSLAFYTSTLFYLLFACFRYSIITSIFSALVIGFGSNIQGIVNAFSGDEGWWGPSRVIKGAINEFPIWSFVLGDVHPHYLNLAAFPFFLIVLFKIIESEITDLTKLLYIILTGIFTLFFTFNSNAWEVPMWGIFGLIITTVFVSANFSFANFFNNNSEPIQTSENSKKTGLTYDRRFLPLLAIFFITLTSLYLSCRNIKGTSQPATLVFPPIEKTTLKEFFLHLGIPLTFITLSLITLTKDLYYKLITIGVIILSLVMYYGYGYLLILLMVALCRFSNITKKYSSKFIVAESIGVLSLILLIIPEFVFLNDSYGGENERMNTIFKIYSFIWFPIHFYAIYLTLEVLKAINLKAIETIPSFIKSGIRFSFLFILLLVSLSFAKQLVTLRSQKNLIKNNQLTDGLGDIEKHFPGSASTIRKLRNLPQGTTLEGQGNAYDWTSHVATLSNQSSYLGWANHINLLVRDYGEVNRREKNSERFYTSTDCESKLELVKNEKIRYMVVGPLERKKYPNISSPESFNCLKMIHEDREYRLYEEK